MRKLMRRDVRIAGPGLFCVIFCLNFFHVEVFIVHYVKRAKIDITVRDGDLCKLSKDCLFDIVSCTYDVRQAQWWNQSKNICKS